VTGAKTKKEPETGARERLLAAALTLFNEKGYAAASVREIVEAAGVTKPVLYYYFGNKEGIYLKLMESSYGSFETLAAKILALEGPVQERIITFCSDLFSASLEKLPEVRFIYAMYFGPPQGAPQFDLEAYFHRMVELIHQLLSSGVATGELAGGSVEDATRAIVAIFISSVNEQLSRRENKIDCDGMVRLLRLVLQGMANAPSLPPPLAGGDQGEGVAATKGQTGTGANEYV
jgi:TetR/AcrR family transcriptional regulator